MIYSEIDAMFIIFLIQRNVYLNAHVYFEVSPGDDWKVRLAKEFIDVKNNQLDLKILTYQELNDILETVTT